MGLEEAASSRSQVLDLHWYDLSPPDMSSSDTFPWVCSLASAMDNPEVGYGQPGSQRNAQFGTLSEWVVRFAGAYHVPA